MTLYAKWNMAASVSGANKNANGGIAAVARGGKTPFSANKSKKGRVI